jgi:predicted XRE-type DNA-binding protein
MSDPIRIHTVADEPVLKAELASALNAVIHQRALSQTEAAALIGTTQPKISQITRYDLRNISIGRLLLALAALNQQVEIRISSLPDPESRIVGVAA